MRAHALPPDAPARRHVRAVVLAIACTCFLLGVCNMCMSMCVHGCMGVCMRVYACVRMCYGVIPHHVPSSHVPSPHLPRLAPPRPSSPSLLSPLLCRILLSSRPACFLSPSLASSVPYDPLPFLSLPIPSLHATPLPSPRFAAPRLSLSLSFPSSPLPVAGISAKYAHLQKSGPM
jgi:hypothetical protein